MRPCRIGTSSGIRLCAWVSIRSIGSLLSAGGSQHPWLDRGTFERARLPRRTCSSAERRSTWRRPSRPCTDCGGEALPSARSGANDPVLVLALVLILFGSSACTEFQQAARAIDGSDRTDSVAPLPRQRLRVCSISGYRRLLLPRIQRRMDRELPCSGSSL